MELWILIVDLWIIISSVISKINAMKKKSTFLILGALCLLIASCSKDPRFLPGPALLPGLNENGFSHVSAITVPPSGGDDTEALTNAIANAKPGTLIKLLAGEYHVGLMEIYDFNGKLVGAGRDKTIIILKTPIPMNSQIEKNQTPGWWRMIGGDFLISDMTFKTPDGFLTDDYEPTFYGRDLYTIFMINNYNDIYYHPEARQKARFERVNFFGGTNWDMSQDLYWVTEHNIWMAIWIGADYWWPADGLVYPLTAGYYTITNCNFEHFLTAAEGFSLGELANMKLNSCRFDNCMQTLYFTANYNSEIFITNNLLLNSTMYDLLIEDLDYGFMPSTPVNPLKKCKYTIMNNIFTVTNQITSLTMYDTWVALDPKERLPMQFMVSGNQFNLCDGSSGILAINNLNATISNNKFKGSCSTGIMVDGAITDRFQMLALDPEKAYAVNCQLILNNFTGMQSDEADIILGTRSKNCTVVGSTNDEIIDNGIKNRIVGMKPVNKRSGFKPTTNDNIIAWHGRNRD